MELDSNQRRIVDIAANKLEKMGWTLVDYTAIAMKSFDSAVGVKVAYVYFSPGYGDDPNCSLRGDYMSEGRNILEPNGQLIPRDADDALVAMLTARFATNAEHVIDGSYAVRLLRKHGVDHRYSPPSP